MTEVTARIFAVIESARDVPGAIEIRNIDNTYFGLAFMCPCGCGAESYLPLQPSSEDGWTWDGNMEKPTLTPSVLQRGCGWHGYLTAGVWKTC